MCRATRVIHTSLISKFSSFLNGYILFVIASINIKRETFAKLVERFLTIGVTCCLFPKTWARTQPLVWNLPIGKSADDQHNRMDNLVSCHLASYCCFSPVLRARNSSQSSCFCFYYLNLTVFSDVNPVEVVCSIRHWELCHPLVSVMATLSGHASYFEQATQFNLKLKDTQSWVHCSKPNMQFLWQLSSI